MQARSAKRVRALGARLGRTWNGIKAREAFLTMFPSYFRFPLYNTANSHVDCNLGSMTFILHDKHLIYHSETDGPHVVPVHGKFLAYTRFSITYSIYTDMVI